MGWFYWPATNIWSILKHFEAVISIVLVPLESLWISSNALVSTRDPLRPWCRHRLKPPGGKTMRRERTCRRSSVGEAVGNSYHHMNPEPSSETSAVDVSIVLLGIADIWCISVPIVVILGSLDLPVMRLRQSSTGEPSAKSWKQVITTVSSR